MVQQTHANLYCHCLIIFFIFITMHVHKPTKRQFTIIFYSQTMTKLHITQTPIKSHAPSIKAMAHGQHNQIYQSTTIFFYHVFLYLKTLLCFSFFVASMNCKGLQRTQLGNQQRWIQRQGRVGSSPGYRCSDYRAPPTNLYLMKLERRGQGWKIIR